MKHITMIGTIALLCHTFAISSAEAQNSSGIAVDGGCDITSAYIWRGIHTAGPSLQPTMSLSAGNFSVSAWGSVDFASTDYKEMDLTLAYEAGPVTLSLTDLYWTGHVDDRYFSVGAFSPHRIEAGIVWEPSPKVPLIVSWYTILFGAADVNAKGKRAYASYFELACPFEVGTVEMKAGIGMVPWNAAATYASGTRDFYVQNVYVSAGKSWNIPDMQTFTFGLFTQLIWNPALEDVNFVGGISLRM